MQKGWGRIEIEEHITDKVADTWAGSRKGPMGALGSIIDARTTWVGMLASVEVRGQDQSVSICSTEDSPAQS